MNELKEQLCIDEWLELIKEDKNLYGAYFSIAQYVDLIEQENQQLKIQISAREEECKKLGKIVRDVGMWNTLYNEEFNKNKKLENNWNKLKEWIKEKDENGLEKLDLEDTVYKINELERGVSYEQR